MDAKRISFENGRCRRKSGAAPCGNRSVAGVVSTQVTDFEDDRKTGLVGHLAARVVNASNNRLVGAVEGDTLALEGEKRAVVLGNISSGGITVAGAPLSSPWLELNLLHL